MVKLICEARLSRILKHIENPETAFAVISAERGKYTDNDNFERTKELEAKIKASEFGYIKLKGGYTEEDSGKMKEEKAFFVIAPVSKKDKLFKFVFNLGKKYDQDAIIYKDDVKFQSIGTNKDTGIGKVLRKFKKDKRNSITLSSDLFKEFFTSLAKGSHAGRKFVYVAEEKLPGGGMGYYMRALGSWDAYRKLFEYEE